MLYAAQNRTVASEPLSYTSGATASVVIDRGAAPGGPFEELKIVANLGRVTTSTNQPITMKLQESDVTNSTTFADISGSTQTSNVTAGVTTGNQLVEWDLTTVGVRKRYIQPVIVTGGTQVIAIQADLARAHISPFNAADKNVAALITI